MNEQDNIAVRRFQEGKGHSSDQLDHLMTEGGGRGRSPRDTAIGRERIGCRLSA